MKKLALFKALLLVCLLMSLATPVLAADGGHGEAHMPPLWLVSFFVVLILAIAILPLTPAHHWWENNWNRLLVAVACGLYPTIYYLQHDWHVLEHAMVVEYIPFIVLLGALYMIAGGIRLTGDLEASPIVNTTFIAVGTALASFIGTTGASMLLIRPILQTNRERKHRVHTVIFFIFLVSNIGGSLLPIGDPPLFLGYLAGIPFFWTLGLWKIWLPLCLTMLLIYFLLDTYYHRKESPRMKEWDHEAVRPMRVEGLINFVWLAGVVACVIFVNQNSSIELFQKTFMREGIMVLLVALSYLTSPKGVRKANRFTMHPIAEVAALFLGIFVAVQPALALLSIRGGELGVDTTMEFFWGTGILSAFLDNAPTYLVFFKTAAGMAAAGGPGAEQVLIGTGIDKVPELFLVAISAGAVFMGAMTYIGNGPNFMVKAIAEEAGIRMPSFGGYMKWSCLFLLPVFVVLTLIFFG